MAQLRGDSKVGGKPIVTLDIMDNFIEQILGTSLDAKINKKAVRRIYDCGKHKIKRAEKRCIP